MEIRVSYNYERSREAGNGWVILDVKESVTMAICDFVDLWRGKGKITILCITPAFPQDVKLCEIGDMVFPFDN